MRQLKKACIFAIALLSVGLIYQRQAYATDVVRGRNATKTIGTLSLLQGTCAADIPSTFDWPADPIKLWQMSGGVKNAILDIPGKIDVAAQRQHGWRLFAGITQLSTKDAGAPPIFHTWYTVEETFDPAPGKRSCLARAPAIRLSLPTQLTMELNSPIKTVLRKSGVEVSPRFDLDPSSFKLNPNQIIADDHEGVVAFSHVAFNKEMYEFLRDNGLYTRTQLNQRLDSAVARKPIPTAPVRGISLKFSWWPAAPDRVTPLPVWDFDPRFPGDAKNPPTSWKRIVVVDPIGGLSSPSSVTLGGFAHEKPDVVSINRFYSVRLTDADVQVAMLDPRLKGAALDVLGRELRAGDFMLLTAMHIATREFEPWVFTTFWWTDKPNVGPLAVDMPNLVTGVWRNFVMDVSYNINNPKTPNNNSPVAYSPWLELFQLGGTRSQCMACHARAAYGPGVQASFNPPRISTADPNGFNATPETPTDPNFALGTLSLDRIWTILTRAK
jgi:hypothetical protein